MVTAIPFRILFVLHSSVRVPIECQKAIAPICCSHSTANKANTSQNFVENVRNGQTYRKGLRAARSESRQINKCHTRRVKNYFVALQARQRS